MISGLPILAPTLTETISSLNLRLNVCDWSPSRAFFTYCWVIVEPPWVCPPLAMLTRARPIPIGSTPESVLNVLFSAEITAFCMSSGICEIGIICRLISPPVAAICVPSAQ